MYWQECNAAWDWVKEPVEDSLSMKWPKRAGAVISTDQGKTYSLHGYLKAEFPLWENNIVELENGDLIMLMRAERSGFYINQSATMGAIPGVKQKNRYSESKFQNHADSTGK